MKKYKTLFATLLLFSFCLVPLLSPALFAAEKKLVKIGFIGPLTGPNAAFGVMSASAGAPVSGAKGREH